MQEGTATEEPKRPLHQVRRGEEHQNSHEGEVMDIKELLELGDKRTQGEWEATKFCQARATAKEKALDTWKIRPIQHRVLGSIDKNNADYVAAAPQMESKLREIVDILPEIKGALIGYGILLDDWNLEDAKQHPDDLHAKIEKWENN